MPCRSFRVSEVAILGTWPLAQSHAAGVSPRVIALLHRLGASPEWIKQHLRIKSHYGTSADAVKTQIWTAISVYVLVAIVRKKLRIERDLYTLLQILSVTLFNKVELLPALSLPVTSAAEE